MKPRLNIDEYAILLAMAAATRSEDPFRKVGAVALDYHNRVIAVAYNGLATAQRLDFTQLTRDERLKWMIHAEQNLCSLFKRGECKTVAVTVMPCTECVKLLAAHAVKRIVYREEYDRDGFAVEYANKIGMELKHAVATVRADWGLETIKSVSGTEATEGGGV